MGYDLTIQDIDFAWWNLLYPLTTFSDGTKASLSFDPYSPEDRRMTMPGISINLYQMVPNYDWCESGGIRTTGFTYNTEGQRVNEVREPTDIPWVFQYRITARTDNPIHDRELMLKIGCLLSNIPQLTIQTKSGMVLVKDARLESSSVYPLVSREIFKDETSSIKKTDQKKYERTWLYTVPIDLPNPKISYERVAEMISWQGGVWLSVDDTHTVVKDGTNIKIEYGIASNVPNQVDLGSGLKATISKVD